MLIQNILCRSGYLPTNIYRLLVTYILSAAVSACTTVPVDERESIRDQLTQVAETTIKRIVTENPDLQQELDDAVGYLVGEVSATKIPIVGGGYGLGLLYDKENETSTYINITRIDFGAGIGAGRYVVLMIFNKREPLEKFRDGKWQPALAAESAAGKSSRSTTTALTSDGYTVHMVSESGAAVNFTARLIKTSINHDLTDVGISEISIPNTGFETTGRQVEDAPRIWDHKLPFLAQQVIDKGYDLPLPYGIGITYANVDQAQVLDSLSVGINGGQVQEYEFVSFDNAESQSDSWSLKADAWLFPFMNVFAMLGQVKGDAPLDVVIDGNGMLEELNVNCGGFLPNPLCLVLEDETIILPIDASFEGNTYGVGTTLAGGWRGWFVALPIVYTIADLDNKDTEGDTFTATPRFGRVFNFGRNGNLALFTGGNYLKTDLTVAGIESTPDGSLVFEYEIDQRNKDRWNIVVGFNWDVNRRLSWAMEYNGFTGSRDAVIGSLNWKY